MIEWERIDDDELAEELSGRANGRRERGERSRCGRWLLAYVPGDGVVAPLWHLWERRGDAWRHAVGRADCEAARADAERIESMRRSRA